MEGSLQSSIVTALESLVTTATPILVAIFGIGIGFFATKYILANAPQWFRKMGGGGKSGN